jgi:hypothetical protein
MHHNVNIPPVNEELTLVQSNTYIQGLINYPLRSIVSVIGLVQLN